MTINHSQYNAMCSVLELTLFDILERGFIITLRTNSVSIQEKIKELESEKLVFVVIIHISSFVYFRL